MGVVIKESGVNFGEFQQKNLLQIEKSELLRKIGSGVRTVEFVLLEKCGKIIFVEAKTGCPNPNSVGIQDETREKFEQFYDEIAEKFGDSLQVFLKGILKGTEEAVAGTEVMKISNVRNATLEFVLVITSDEILEDWLVAPKEELEYRLKKIRKIWGIKVSVLNKELARKKGLLKE